LPLYVNKAKRLQLNTKKVLFYAKYVNVLNEINYLNKVNKIENVLKNIDSSHVKKLEPEILS